MTETISCGFARVFLWKTKRFALENLNRESNESNTKFRIRILDERYNLFKEKFKHYERMHLDRGKVSSPIKNSAFCFMTLIRINLDHV